MTTLDKRHVTWWCVTGFLWVAALWFVFFCATVAFLCFAPTPDMWVALLGAHFALTTFLVLTVAASVIDPPPSYAH